MGIPRYIFPTIHDRCKDARPHGYLICILEDHVYIFSRDQHHDGALLQYHGVERMGPAKADEKEVGL